MILQVTKEKKIKQRFLTSNKLQIYGKKFCTFILLTVTSEIAIVLCQNMAFILQNTAIETQLVTVCPSVLVLCSCVIVLPVRSTTSVTVSNFHATSLILRCWFFLISRSD